MDKRTERRAWAERARALKPLLAGEAAAIEARKDLTPRVREAMHAAGLFKLVVPRSLGGAELDPATFAQVVAAVAEGDGSAAWCVAQTAGCSMAAAYLDPAIAQEIFGAPDSVVTFGFAQPPCTALPAEGGWIVNGTWSFGSGNRLCRWLGGHTVLCDAAGTPRKQADGRPVERTMLFPRSRATVREDQWDVIGLAGTGSDTYSVTDLFVPAAYSVVPRVIPRDQQLPEGVRAEPDPERRERGTLYRFSSQAIFQVGLTSVAIGLARASIDEFVALAQSKSPSSALQSLRNDAWIHARVAQADAKVSAAQAWLEKLLDDAWDECLATGEASFPLRMKIRSACTHQMTEAREAVDMVYLEAGTTAIFKSNAFERRFRDMHTASQQVQGSIARMQIVGQYQLGIAPKQFFLLP